MELIGQRGIFNLLIVFILTITIRLDKFCLSQKVEVQIVEDVMNKLDKFAAGKSESSMLTIHDLRAATEQFMSWDEKNKKSFKRRYHQIKLLEDFLFVPMSRFCDLIDSDEKMKCDDDEEMRQDYVRRLELFYKQFKPAYQGEMLGNEYANSKKTNVLIASLLDLNNHEPLSKKILVEATKEYRAYQKRIDDIAKHEDIFSCVQELTLELNYSNRGEVKLLAERIFPLVENESSLIDENLDSLKSLYKIEFSKLKDYQIHEGAIVKIRRI